MNLLDDLNALVEQAVANTFGSDERLRQQGQTKKIDKDNLRVTGTKEKDVEESEEDEEDEETKSKKKPTKVGGDEMPKLTGDPEKVAKAAEKREKASMVPGTSTSKNLHDPTGKELKQPDFRTIAKNINLLRGGKSIKDDEVKRNLKDYVAKLSPLERREVLIYLNSLAQVMAGVKSGSDAAEPDHTALASGAETPKKSKTAKVPPPKPASKQDGVIVVGAS